MEPFYTQLTEALSPMDPHVHVDEHRILHLLNVQFPIYSGLNTYYLLRGRFSRRANGTYDIKRAVRLILEALPHRLRELEAAKDKERRLQEFKTFVAGIVPGVSYVDSAWCQVLDKGYVRCSSEGYQFMMKADSLDHLAAVLDALQEVGLLLPKRA